ncbi:MAG TPA: single-stranded-DNA-specific exonuclease RecJ [Candidatus Sulfotelmatobacter sp.]|nr:single-stranded-DNA-specific exonuclease RecJ [Candidatus Sulfotelmatobacter sp.]
MKWAPKTANATHIESLARELCSNAGLGVKDASLASTLARLLTMRGITDPDAAARFLSPSLAHLHLPEHMTGLRAAVDRIEAAIERKDPILIYGDYDVDGTMAVIILKTAIELCGGAADFHVPHRIREGYDLRDDVIERAAAAGIRLIISVDMGIRAFAPAETARRLGVDLIVTDHHLPGPDGVPKALAVVNPNQAGCEYPYKQLCGAGVVFKVVQGLMQRRLDAKDQNKLLLSFMKVAAIATIADAVPLTGENRVFAKLGLDALRHAVNPGLKALLEVAQISSQRPPTSTEVAFRIAPRINAAGRMDVARDVIELFSVKDAARARELAAKLDHLNTERQEEERRIFRSLEERISGDPALCEAYCIVLDGEGWHRGVIGITATRVVERYNRPTLVISRDGEEAFGSGRSIRAFHLLEAVESCRDLFSRYGGHAHACGFAMPAANIEPLRARLDAFARERLTLKDFDPVLEVDAELRFDEITPALFRALSLLEPYGVGNPEPVFSARGAKLTAPPRILKEKHIKLKLQAGAIPARVGTGAPPVPPAAEGAFDPAPESTENASQDLSQAAILAAPRCHPDSATIPKCDLRAAENNRHTEAGNSGAVWRRSITIDALAWNMAERLRQSPLLTGDTIDIAFTIGHNDHPEYGGLELSLRDLKVPARDTANGVSNSAMKNTVAVP